MYNFQKAFKIAMSLEFASMYDALHKNKGEKGLTFMGIYEKAHPSWCGWEIIHQICKDYPYITKASKECYESIILDEMVQEFYKKEFWDKLRLDKINDEIIRVNLFCLGINIGHKNAIKIFQKIAHISQTGKINDETINAINKIDKNKAYIQEIKEYYKEICRINPSKKVFLKGWLNRVEKIQNAINKTILL